LGDLLNVVATMTDVVDFWDVLKRRHSVRRFDASRDVPEKMIKTLLKAAVSAPSAGNCQPWRYIVVRQPEVKEALAVAAWGQYFLSQAPVVIAVCAEPARSAARYGKRGVELYCLQDTAAAAENILLGATALGLGACWVGAFDEEQAAEALSLDQRFRPVALIPVGYAASEPPASSSRRLLDEVVDTIG
jgi:nitroreductase